jgi:hypothetical protein
MRKHNSFLALLLSLMLATPAWAGMEDGLIAYSQRDYLTALAEFRPLAEKGDSIAQYRIGFMHYFGQGVPQDYGKALQWYKLAAEGENAEATYSVARMYNAGLGVPQDYAIAKEWFKRAAEMGHGDAQADLGIMYFVGMKISRDHVEALKWLSIASSLGVEIAPKYGDIVAGTMTDLQIDEAQRLADDWLADHLKPN